MNQKIRDLPPGWWVFTSLPDGRVAVADHADPIAPAIIRLGQASAFRHHERFPGRPADYAAVADWLDQTEPLPVGQLPLWGATVSPLRGRACDDAVIWTERMGVRLMSIEAIVWAIEDAPGVPPQCVAVLIGLANKADADGTGAYPSKKTLATYARKSSQQVKRDLEILAELGLIRLGDQRKVRHIRPDRRTTVWDLAIERVRGDVHDTPSDVERGIAHDTPLAVDNRPRGTAHDISSTARGIADGESSTVERGITHDPQPVHDPKPSPPPPPARQRTLFWPGPVPSPGEGEFTQAEDHPNPLVALAAELADLRKDWTRRQIASALSDPSVIERTAGWPELVHRAAVLCAMDRATMLPARIAKDGPWWAQARAQLLTTGASATEPWCEQCSDPVRRQDLTDPDHPKRCETCHPMRAAS